MKVLVNHMGYGVKGPKKAVVQCSQGEKPAGFALLDSEGKQVLQGSLKECGEVARWKTGLYWTADFSSLETEGTYVVKVDNPSGAACSDPFEINRRLNQRMISGVGYWFKAMRSTGEWFICDHCLPFSGDRQGRVDVHGGWYDATGDYGIHLSHLSHSSVHNPQQLSFSAYAFFKIFEYLEQSGNEEYSMVKRRMLDEGSFGANFLMRMRAPSGTFFRSINRKHAFHPVADSRSIGFEYHRSSSQFSTKAATADEETIGDENYETSLRSGGGMAIAALAIAARFYYPNTEYSAEDYIMAAKRSWDYLSKNNERYTNDGAWNLIDEYCALMAVTELYKTTGEYGYVAQLRDLYGKIAARMEDAGDGMLRLTVLPGKPFYHAVDEGMPVVAMLQYAEAEPDCTRRAEIIAVCEKLMRWKLKLTDDGANPFGYPKFEHRDDDDGKIKVKFFFPHNTTAKPWWQGDNARIASLSAAARTLSYMTTDAALKVRLARYAQDSLDWIMGLNPYDSCMIEGYGKNNIQYFFNDRYDFLNSPGGIVNGITSDLDDEESIGYVTKPGYVTKSGEKIIDNWRWAEQWIPHVSWYLYAMALKKE